MTELADDLLVNPAFGDDQEREEVDHPDHYGGDTTYETIKVIEAWGLDKDFCLGNTVKYISRAGKKDPTLLKDLKKALWYLQRRIDRLEAGHE